MNLKIDELRLAAKQKKCKCPKVKERLLALIELSKCTKSIRQLTELDFDRVGAKFGKSGRTLHRWKKGWDESGFHGLVPKTSPGRRKRPISGFIAKKIVEYRMKYNWGAEVIQAHLKEDFGKVISENRIHRYLNSRGLLKKIRKPKTKNKHTKIVKVEKPGAHTQNDVKHLPHILQSKEKCYVYNFVDHASKWEFKHAYLSYGAAETKDFVDRVLKNCPFQITRWQTDNGIEFTYKYVSHVDKPKKHPLDKVCERNKIRHVLIPPGEKELQGLVERNHRMDEDELYHRITPKDINELNRYLDAHYKWKNSSRRRKALEWKTPNQWLKEYGKNILSGFVRHKDPLDSVVPVPNDVLVLKKGWEHQLVETWSHLARNPNTKNIGQSGPFTTRQNVDVENQQTEEQAQSVSGTKKAA